MLRVVPGSVTGPQTLAIIIFYFYLILMCLPPDCKLQESIDLAYFINPVSPEPRTGPGMHCLSLIEFMSVSISSVLTVCYSAQPGLLSCTHGTWQCFFSGLKISSFCVLFFLSIVVFLIRVLQVFG